MTDCTPLIISGAPRSGTTLLYNLFDGHPDINWLATEGYFFEYLFELMDVDPMILVDSSKRDLDAMIEGIRDRDVLPPLYRPRRQGPSDGSATEAQYDIPWSEEDFRAALSSCRTGSVGELWRGFALACIAGLKDRPRRYVCLKAADYGKSACAATASVEGARAIVIVRDPLRSIDSLKRSRAMRGEKLLSWPTMAMVVAEYRRMMERVTNAGSGQVKLMRFEDLVAEPVETMRDMADWLAIPFQESLTSPTFLGQSWPGFSSFGPTRNVDAEAARRPIQSLTSDDVSLIEKYLRPFMLQFGYAA